MPDTRPSKGVYNPLTGENDVVPVTDAEWDDIKAHRASAEAAALADAEASTSAAAILAALPTDQEITDAKTTDLKTLMLRQNAVLRLVMKRLGLDG